MSLGGLLGMESTTNATPATATPAALPTRSDIESPEAHHFVVYQGGGYDGCVWEWNVFRLDGDGCFRDVFSSGYAGVSTPSEYDDISLGEDDFKVWASDAKAEVFDPRDEASWGIFCREYQASFVLGVGVKLGEAGYDVRLPCGQCGHSFAPEDMASAQDMYEGGYYKGNGGIGIVVTDSLCGGCLHDACHVECSKCGVDTDRDEAEYRGSEEAPVCDSCHHEEN